jgi:hypothetical protein
MFYNHQGKYSLYLITAILLTASCITKNLSYKTTSSPTSCTFVQDKKHPVAQKNGDFVAHKATTKVQIDGCVKEAAWNTATWYDMNYLWIGSPPKSTDYDGRFKITWDENYLYLLVHIKDDYLHPTLKDGIENYWKGDYVEIFIDEDQSGGNHQYNLQAFAYHVSTDGHSIDKNTTRETVFFDNHIHVARSQEGNTYVWEMAVKLYDKQFDENATNNSPVKIHHQKRIGFSIAYGDNDGDQERENFMGSKEHHGINNDYGYINADVFGSILFVD